METIGRYKIVSELGRGGMATVYHAIDPSFERDVAVKVLPRAFLHDPQFRARFEREAKVVAALEHPAIVPVYDFGEDDGQPYIVMRLMAGGSLADKLRNGKLTMDQATQVALRVAAALDVAHRKGIIHRDLKPGNILFDQDGNAYLSDFGIARIAESGATLTGSNILGTPAYMSPEQVQGERQLDGRSDIYSLGVLFYQMLVGNTPYQATTPAKVMMMHILEPVPSLLTALPDVSPPVVAWFEKSLAKDPEDRFSTAGEMVTALQAASRGERHPTLDQTRQTPLADKTVMGAPVTMMTPPPGTRTPPPNTPPPQAPISGAYPAPPKAGGVRWLPVAFGGIVIIGIVAIAAIAVFLLGLSGTGPLAMLAPAISSATPTATIKAAEATATDIPTETPTVEEVVILPEDEPTLTPSPTEEEILPTNTATETILPATETPEPSPTEEPTITLTPTPDALVLGGADKIAFVENNEIWVMNLDGSEIAQLTDDGAQKERVGWTPDGSAVTYISGKCVWSVELESGRLDHIACFEYAKFLDDFSVSTDGTRVAVSVNSELFVVPYDRDALSQASRRNDLIEMGICEGLAPLKTSTNASVIVNQVRWSHDDFRIATMVKAPEGGIQVDLIRYIDISDCDHPDLLDEFPATRFEIDGYDNTPYLQNFGYDGDILFAMSGYKRNDGYGDLYIYNTGLHRADKKVNPIEGLCCYRDPQFSPDGSYIIFVYQPYEAGATAELYYVLYATISAGGRMEPLPVPEGFFANPKAKPQPALRPAGTGQ